MNEIEIIRLNIDRFRRLLQTETDENARRTIRKMIGEFEAKLPSAEAALTSKAVDLD